MKRVSIRKIFVEGYPIFVLVLGIILSFMNIDLKKDYGPLFTAMETKMFFLFLLWSILWIMESRRSKL